MKRLSFWLLDKLLLVALAFLMLGLVFITIDLFSKGELDHLSFALKRFDSEIFRLDQSYMASPTENKYMVLPTEVSFNASGEFGRIWAYALKVIPLIVSGIIIWSLWSLICETKKGRFFNLRNVKLLKRISMMFIVMEFILWFEQLIGSYYFNLLISGKEHARFGINVLPDFTNYFVVGLLIYVVAEAFAQGLKLKEEQELII